MHNIQSPRPITDETIEDEIRRKGLTAARVTPEDVEAEIVRAYYFTARQGVDGADIEAIRREIRSKSVNLSPLDEDPDPSKTEIAPLNLLIFCVLVLRNGFTVTGESACASPENFDAEVGRKIARQNAVNKIWPLLGYELKTKLSNA